MKTIERTTSKSTGRRTKKEIKHHEGAGVETVVNHKLVSANPNKQPSSRRVHHIQNKKHKNNYTTPHTFFPFLP